MSPAINLTRRTAVSQKTAQKLATKSKAARSPSMTGAQSSANRSRVDTKSASCPNGTVLATSTQAVINKHGGRANMYLKFDSHAIESSLIVLYSLAAFDAQEAKKHAQTRTEVLIAPQATWTSMRVPMHKRPMRIAHMHAQFACACTHICTRTLFCEHIGSARLGGRLAEGMSVHSAQKVHRRPVPSIAAIL